MPTRRTVPPPGGPRLCGEISMGFPRDLRWGWSRETWGWTGHMTNTPFHFPIPPSPPLGLDCPLVLVLYVAAATTIAVKCLHW